MKHKRIEDHSLKTKVVKLVTAERVGVIDYSEKLVVAREFLKSRGITDIKRLINTKKDA